ncbi:Methylthioribulose-1-phosphate dehydratase [Elasticomyces elasticus]|nr:Methylthioribulose-1-phosphate dehydratase [Elasticomyces elasticus]
MASHTSQDPDTLVTSPDPMHPANHISELCRKFYDLGWVTGTGGGVSIKKGDHVYLAPSGVQKEMMQPEDMFVMDWGTKQYIRKPPVGTPVTVNAYKPSACTPLFLAAYTHRGAGCCIHTHSQWAVLVTLICEALPNPAERNVFAIKEIEQIKGISRGSSDPSSTSDTAEIAEGGRYFDTLRIPIIENTAHEEDLEERMAEAMREWPECAAVLVRRHGVYVWGKDVGQAKTQAESLDYLFQLGVRMHGMGLKWT